MLNQSLRIGLCPLGLTGMWIAECIKIRINPTTKFVSTYKLRDILSKQMDPHFINILKQRSQRRERRLTHHQIHEIFNKFDTVFKKYY